MLVFMKSPSPLLLPLLRSRAQGEVLAWIMLHPDDEFSLVELAAAVGVSPPTVMREVDRLVALGARTRLVRPRRTVLEAPGGTAFCVVEAAGELR